jgi:hypothetical protein
MEEAARRYSILFSPPISALLVATGLIMLYLVGLGLADETDITVKGLEVVRKAKRVYLEAYTSILLVEREKLVCLPSHLDSFPAYECFISRNPSMDDQSLSPTAKWSRLPALRS